MADRDRGIAGPYFGPIRRDQQKEIDRLRGQLEQVHDLLEEVAEMLPSGRAWGLVRAALEKSDLDTGDTDV